MADNYGLSGQEILILANSLSLLIADDRKISDLVYIGTLLSEIGSGLITIAAINRLREGTQNTSISGTLIASNLIPRE